MPYSLVDDDDLAELHATFARLGGILSRIGTPVAVSNLVETKRPVDFLPVREGPKMVRAVTPNVGRGELKRDVNGKLLIARGRQGYADVADALLPDEFTIAEGWDMLLPQLASADERSREFFRRALQRDTKRFEQVTRGRYRKVGSKGEPPQETLL